LRDTWVDIVIDIGDILTEIPIESSESLMERSSESPPLMLAQGSNASKNNNKKQHYYPNDPRKRQGGKNCKTVERPGSQPMSICQISPQRLLAATWNLPVAFDQTNARSMSAKIGLGVLN